MYGGVGSCGTMRVHASPSLNKRGAEAAAGGEVTVRPGQSPVKQPLAVASPSPGAGPVGGGLMTTGVSVEESRFLDEFMACDFSRDRSNLGSLADLSSVSGSLTELDNLPRPNTR